MERDSGKGKGSAFKQVLLFVALTGITLCLFGGDYDFGVITRVVDGDTMKVLVNDSEITLRLVGVDTAETVHPTKPKTDAGIEASKYSKETLTGQQVLIVYSVPKTDWYKRYLGYLYLVDADVFPAKLICYNVLLVEEGYSVVYTKYKFLFMKEFINALQ